MQNLKFIYINKEDAESVKDRLRRLSHADGIGCRVWHGLASTSGSPRFRLYGSLVDARRAALAATHPGHVIPVSGSRMRPTCGEPGCVQVSHLPLPRFNEVAPERYTKRACCCCARTFLARPTAEPVCSPCRRMQTAP